VAQRTLPELLDLWIRNLVANDRSPHTVRLYAIAARQFLRWSGDQEGRALSVDDLTPIALLGYRNELQHRRARAPRTVNAHVAALRAWCSSLEESGHHASNPAKRLKFVGQQARVSAGLTHTQINALCARLSEHTTQIEIMRFFRCYSKLACGSANVQPLTMKISLLASEVGRSLSAPGRG
jgi:integrase